MALAFSAAYAQAEGGGAVCAAGHDSFTESGRRLVTAASGVVDFPLLTQYVYGSKSDKCHLEGLFTGDVNKIRFAFVPYESEGAVSPWDYLTGDGWETRTYTLTPDKPEIDIPFTGAVRYALFALCFDAAGNQLYGRILKSYIFSNYRGKDTWHSIGTGTLTEKISYIMSSNNAVDENGAVKATPWRYSVEVEVSDSNPALFRVKNPFGPSHPNFKNLPYIDNSYIMEHFPSLQGDDYYLVFDCSDPSRVRMDYSLCGLDYGFTPVMSFSGPRNLQGWDKWSDKDVDREYPWEWGKYRDNVIVFYSGSIFFNHTVVDYANPSVRDLTLLLPGYVNYEFSMQKVTQDDVEYVKFYDVLENVASFDCALVPERDRINARFFEEDLYKRLVDKDPSLDIHSYRASEGLMVPTKDFKTESPGNYFVIALSRDAAGNPHRGHYLGNLVRYVPFGTSRWNYVGKAHFHENVVASHEFIGLDEYETDVDVYECPGLPGYYALDHPYKALAAKAGNVSASNNMVLYINATDPDAVYFNRINMDSFLGSHEINTGLEVSSTKEVVKFYSNYNWHARQFWNDRVSIPLSGCEYYAGKLRNGIITFDAASLSNRIEDERPATVNGLFMTIALPSSGVEGVVAEGETDAAPVYFNLQGVRVDNPSAGVYIRVCGNKSTKVVVK